MRQPAAPRPPDHQAPDHAHHGASSSHGHGAELADLLDLDAEVLGSYLAELVSWAGGHAASDARTVVDIGAGTGRGSLALARQFPLAEVVALDRSDDMLKRIRVAAQHEGLADRLRVVPADLDTGWPSVGRIDVAWASSALHEVGDPDRLLRDLHTALRPGGVLVVVELDTHPRFLPDDLGHGRPGLEIRCHAALLQAGWNAYPNWRPHLEGAGFDLIEQRVFRAEATAGDGSAASTQRFARAYLSRMRPALTDWLDNDDLTTIDLLLSENHPDGLAHRTDLAARSSRTAWAARRP